MTRQRLRDGGRERVPMELCLPGGVWLLTAAAAGGHLELVQRLLKAKADPNPPTCERGDFPLAAACSAGHQRPACGGTQR
mgnify:CR=1 FL=1